MFLLERFYGNIISLPTALSKPTNAFSLSRFVSTPDIDECSSSPCQNGATCEDQRNGYVCRCDSEYSGVHCETGGCGDDDDDHHHHDDDDDDDDHDEGDGDDDNDDEDDDDYDDDDDDEGVGDDDNDEDDDDDADDDDDDDDDDGDDDDDDDDDDVVDDDDDDGVGDDANDDYGDDNDNDAQGAHTTVVDRFVWLGLVQTQVCVISCRTSDRCSLRHIQQSSPPLLTRPYYIYTYYTDFQASRSLVFGEGGGGELFFSNCF